MCDQCKIIHFHFHDNDRDNEDDNDNDDDNYDDDDDDDVTYLSIPYLLWWGRGWWSHPGCTPPCTGRRRQTSSCLSWTSPTYKHIININFVTIIISITFRPFLAALPCTVTLGFFFRQNLGSQKIKILSVFWTIFTYTFLPTMSLSPFLHFFLSLLGRSRLEQENFIFLQLDFIL